MHLLCNVVLITSVEDRRLCFDSLFVCWSLCLFARLLKKLWTDFDEIFGGLERGPRNNRPYFGLDPDLDPGFLKGFFICYSDCYRQPRIKHENPVRRFEVNEYFGTFRAAVSTFTNAWHPKLSEILILKFKKFSLINNVVSIYSGQLNVVMQYFTTSIRIHTKNFPKLYCTVTVYVTRNRKEQIVSLDILVTLYFALLRWVNNEWTDWLADWLTKLYCSN